MAPSDNSAPGFDADLEPDEFRRLGYRAVDMIADYYGTVRDRPVYPDASPEEITAAFDQPLPEEGVDVDDLLDEWAEHVLPYATHNTSPRYYGFVMGSGTMVGTLAEALAASVNMNTGGWHPAPSATEIERRCVVWLAEAIGYPAVDGGGILTSGGTMANVTALATALRERAEGDLTQGGLQGVEGRYRLYIADHEAHSSVVRAADLLGLGRGAIRYVPSEDFRMDADALEAAVESDLEAGDRPFCVVGQAGSINASAVDPLDAIADVCERHGLWFHADGACGAVGAMVPEWRDRYVGLERADSVTLDPHKWLFVPYECGAVLVHDPATLARSFAMDASYLRGSIAETPEEFDYYEYGPQMSRGFRALKLWMSLKHYGVSGYRDLLRRNVACAGHLHERVESHPDFLTVQEPNLFIYSFRYVPADLGDVPAAAAPRVNEYLDELTQATVDEVVHSGESFLTTTSIHGRKALRMSICSHRTTAEDVDRTFDALEAAGERLDDEWRENASLPI